MRNFAEILALPSEDVKNIAEVYESFAQVKLEQNAGFERRKAASYLLLSACYYLIFDQKKSKELFASSGGLFKSLGSPLWRLCSICAQDSFTEVELIWKNRGFVDSNIDRFYFLLQSYVPLPIELSDIPQKETGAIEGMVDLLNIPFATITDVLMDTQNWELPERNQYLRKFEELFRRMNEITEVKRRDSFHWRSLLGDFLPFEPVSVAIAVVFVNRWKRFDSFANLLQSVDLPSETVVLLEIANKLDLV